MRIFKLILLIFLMIQIFNCYNKTSKEEKNSGVQGQVLIGPMRAAMSSDKIITDKPYQTKINILNEKREIITQIETDKEGRFQIPLKPGTYIISPIAPKPNTPPYPEEKTVVVKEGEFLETKVLFDTGIR